MMRVLLTFLTAAILVAVGLHTQTCRATSVGLFADAEHSIMSASGPGEFSVYVWWLPGDNGLERIRLLLSFPANTQILNEAVNPVFNLLVGCYVMCPGPMVLCSEASPCQFDWVWSDRIDYLLLDADPSVIEIVPCPDEPVLQATTCYPPGFYKEPAVILNKFGLNQGPVIAVDRSSWGAIRSLYR